MRRHRLLFLAKKRQRYWGNERAPLSSGLRNSVNFVVAMLLGLGIEAKFVEVLDNNSIDGEVAAYRPTHAVVEALWVVPEKFDVLRRLHPRVQWIVRNHSEVPFLASEGIALDWVPGYLARGVEVASNSRRAERDLRAIAHAAGLPERLVTWLPNHYPLWSERASIRPSSGHLDVGCFGAIRPLKNQLIQAVAAIVFADDLRVGMRFHINASRVEGRGEPILKNLRSLFAAARRHTLVEHEWLPHEEFVEFLRRMDVVLQVSFSETFNIVAADAVAAGVPVVVSPEISWLGHYAHAHPTDTSSVVAALYRALQDPRRRVRVQFRDLAAFNVVSEMVWGERFG